LAVKTGVSLSVLLGALVMGVASLTPVQAGAELGSSYVPLAPQRILDTRTTGQTLGPGGELSLTVTGGSVPVDATAVGLNVTVTDTSAGGWLAVFPAGESLPLESNLNWTAGETVPNLVIVPVGSDGQVTFFNSAGSTDVVADLEGYFAPEGSGTTAGSYVPLTPARITDTRAGSGEPNSGDPLTPQGTLNLQLDGEGGVPSTGVEAVVLNVTVTDTSQYSYLTAYPSGSAMPLASNLNWWPGDTVANRVIAPVGVSGQVSIYNGQGNADLVVDAVGYFTDGTSNLTNASLYYPMSPIRVLDTRLDAGTLGANSYLSEQLAGVDGISSIADAIVGNLTSTNAAKPSYFSVVPEQTTPTTSDVNFSANQTVPNLVITSLNSEGETNIYNDQGTADAVLDVFGFFEPEGMPGPAAAAPCTSANLTLGATTVTQGTPLTVTASSSCPGTVSYEYWYQAPYSSVWVLAQGWSSNDSYSYDTSNWAPGTYGLAMWASTGSAYQSVTGSASVLSNATVLVSQVTYSAQIYSMTCEEASLEMALSHEGISVTQQQVLNAEGVNQSVPGIGPAYTRADPMVNFVGPPNGGDAAGYEPGAYYGAIADAADRLGGDVIAAGENITPTAISDYVDQNHPVVVWVTIDFHVDYGTTWLTNGIHTWPWAGPDEHAVLIVGINNNSVLIDNPLSVRRSGVAYYGQDQWVPMGTFENVYGVYGDMAVVLK
jgi:uncharacterized protein YvpB